jgi:hypothetical protein
MDWVTPGGLFFATKILRRAPRGYSTILSLRPDIASGEPILTAWLISAARHIYVEYKTRERIHRSIADLRLLAIPAS